MKGFISTHVTLKNVAYKIRYRTAMQDAGFRPDKTHNVYVKKGFGALVRNVDKRIKNIEDILTYKDEVLGVNPYEDIAQMIKTGRFKFVFGPAAPSLNGIIYREYWGLYCKNYLNIVHYIREGSLEI